jgi:alpha-L-fucosidase
MNHIKIMQKSVLIFLAALLAMPVNAQQMNEMWGQQNGKTAESSRGRFFEWGNYAMFIHWGLYSGLANKWEGATYYGIGEWIMNSNMANIPVDTYKATAKNFNPVLFDAKKIAQLAKDAGMKYIIITSKHHDGFAMYHSACNPFNIVDATPFGRDPMKELAAACKEAGLGFGFYYSHNQDWTYPGGSGGPETDKDGNRKTFDDYFVEKCLPQVEEITKNYGDIELIWFDTPGGIPEKYARQLVEVVHRNQPRALVSGRVGFNLGDYSTFGDMEVPLENVEGPWEGVDVTNDSWGYAWYDENWKSPKQILSYLISTIARGGTYMLNVGPDGLGRIPEPAQDFLRAAGRWIARYPQVIYHADASPWKHALPWGDVVCNNGKLYLAVYQWPSTGKLYLPGLQSEIASVSLLSDQKKPQKLTFAKEGTWTVIQTPYQAPDHPISVIEITPKGAVQVTPLMAVDPEFGLEMSAKFSKTLNCEAKYINWMEKFGEWKHLHQIDQWQANSSATWECEIKTPGRYLIELTVAGAGPIVWRVETAEGHAIQNRQNSSSIYHTQPIGWLSFDKAGKHSITVKLGEKDIPEKASLSAIKITPN